MKPLKTILHLGLIAFFFGPFFSTSTLADQAELDATRTSKFFAGVERVNSNFQSILPSQSQCAPYWTQAKMVTDSKGFQHVICYPQLSLERRYQASLIHVILDSKGDFVSETQLPRYGFFQGFKNFQIAIDEDDAIHVAWHDTLPYQDLQETHRSYQTLVNDLYYMKIRANKAIKIQRLTSYDCSKGECTDYQAPGLVVDSKRQVHIVASAHTYRSSVSKYDKFDYRLALEPSASVIYIAIDSNQKITKSSILGKNIGVSPKAISVGSDDRVNVLLTETLKHYYDPNGSTIFVQLNRTRAGLPIKSTTRILTELGERMIIDSTATDSKGNVHVTYQQCVKNCQDVRSRIEIKYATISSEGKITAAGTPVGLLCDETKNTALYAFCDVKFYHGGASTLELTNDPNVIKFAFIYRQSLNTTTKLNDGRCSRETLYVSDLNPTTQKLQNKRLVVDVDNQCTSYNTNNRSELEAPTLKTNSETSKLTLCYKTSAITPSRDDRKNFLDTPDVYRVCVEGPAR